jgi:hypothetical protein
MVRSHLAFSSARPRAASRRGPTFPSAPPALLFAIHRSPAGITSLLTFFCTLLHFFASRKKLSPFFSSNSRLFAQNSRGGVSAVGVTSLHASSGLLAFDLQRPTVDSPLLTPFLATLTKSLQLTEKSGTLTPAVAALTQFVTSNSFICHSYEKTPGVGHPRSLMSSRLHGAEEIGQQAVAGGLDAGIVLDKRQPEDIQIEAQRRAAAFQTGQRIGRQQNLRANA